jgi:hypothetical protein
MVPMTYTSLSDTMMYTRMNTVLHIVLYTNRAGTRAEISEIFACSSNVSIDSVIGGLQIDSVLNERDERCETITI